MFVQDERLNKEDRMFLKRKAKKAYKKIISGASGSEIEKAVKSVVKEASRQVSRKMAKMDLKLPLKI